MIHVFGFGYSRGKGEGDIGQYDKPEVIGYSSGACLFMSSKILDKIGMFDPFLFAYHDDLDLGWRAAQLGIKSYYIPKSIVYHADSYSFKWSSYKFFLLERNRHYCLLTSYSRITLLKILPALILVEIVILFFYLSKGLIKSKIKGYINIIKNRKQVSRRYKELQKKRTVSDKEIIKNFQNKISIPDMATNYTRTHLINNFVSTLSRISRVLI